ncbi:dipeptidase PepE [Pseudonocardia sp. WMMC193]|uniref:dipeptidase PepE n=1 Tax=Pseudonocardia sp. WMMC193 TaxID=2911965 RepID=UPI001F01753A|nr:dipeptidase PepE [Pseudonocardia sp. WMMC193]MCF7548866.1 dipeptidase PepE [Pseudonocardia sp. WMMC193]
MSELLLLSNSTNHGAQPLDHAPLAEFYGGRTVLFVPYALADHAGYATRIGEAFARAGVALRSVHTEPDPAAALAAAEAVWVGGGNTFRLLATLQRIDGLLAIGTAVAAGAHYGGASAGTNLACPTIRTTNDMPIVEPAGFAALGLVDFQVNAHYLDPLPGSTHMGETRAERIREFHEENETPVVGLREGGLLRVSGESVTLTGRARVFRRGAQPEEVADGPLRPWGPPA